LRTVGNFDTGFELTEETISSLREKLSSGTHSSEQLVRMWPGSIAVDKNGAKLNAVIEINSAIALAKAMDLEMKAGVEVLCTAFNTYKRQY
jgi:amidase